MTDTTSTPAVATATDTTFEQFNLPEALMAALNKMNFTNPTPIQLAAIPAALEGKDVLGSAQTGTGKTGAFGIPLVAKLLGSSRGSALVLTPTRELAMQVITMMEQLIGKNSAIKTALLIGGDPMPKQLQQLRQRPRLIVGTPGRINDHLGRGSLMLHDTSFLVLDETDRMLDMGFGIQLDAIAKFLPAQRQTLMFSATMPHNIMAIAKKYLVEPVRVSVGESNAPIAKINQENINTSEAGKYDVLLDQLEERDGSVIIFVKTKYSAERMAMRLRNDNHSADAIHGDLRQNKRERVIQAFRNRRHRIMVATDIAARGLDIPHIEHVINFDLPQCPEDYIHRVGRTGRAGAEGAAVNLITPQDALKWRAIERLINPGAGRENAPFGRVAAGGGKAKPARGGFGGGRSEARNSRGDSYAPRGEGRPARSEGGNDFRAPRGEGRPARSEGGNAFRAPRGEGRPARSEGGNAFRAPRGEGRPARSEGGNDFRAPRGEGRPARSEGGNDFRAPRGEGRPARSEGGNDFRAPRGEGRPARSEGGNDFRAPRGEGRPARSEGGNDFRAPRGEGRPARSEGGNDFRAPRGEGRPARSEGGNDFRAPRGEGRPARSEGGNDFRAPRGEGRPARSESGFGTRNAPRGEGRPARAEGGRPTGGKPAAGKRFGGKPATGGKSFGGNSRPQRRQAS